MAACLPAITVPIIALNLYGPAKSKYYHITTKPRKTKAHMYIYTHTYTHTRMYACTHVCMHTHTHTHTHTPVQSYTHTRTHFETKIKKLRKQHNTSAIYNHSEITIKGQ